MAKPRNTSPTRSPLRLGVISDVHGDAEALDLALARLAELACSQIVSAGDLVDWGARPERTIAIVQAAGIACVRGNHDSWAVQAGEEVDGRPLTERSLRYLEALPETWRSTIAGVPVAVCHARPGDDMRGIHSDEPIELLEAMLTDMRAEVLIVGHTHLPMHLSVSGGAILNPGAILRSPVHPLDGVPVPGTFGVLELPSKAFTVYRVDDGAEVAPVDRPRGALKPRSR